MITAMHSFKEETLWYSSKRFLSKTNGYSRFAWFVLNSKNGKTCYRKIGPSIITITKDKWWYENKKYPYGYRKNGPNLERNDGYKSWSTCLSRNCSEEFYWND